MVADTGAGADVLLVEHLGAVAVLTMNRPEARNALDAALLGALKTSLGAAVDDPEIRAVVLTGAGDRAFCAGMDLKGFVADDRTASSTSSTTGGDGFDAVEPVIPWDLPLPLVAAVNGAAVAGGFELMMSCDVVVAADHAVFGLSEVKRGLIPGGGGTALGTRIPLGLALELCLTGDNVDAARAREIGLVNRVVPAAEVLEAATEIAARIAQNGPLAVAAVKRLMRGGARSSASAAWPDGDTLRQIFASDDAREGATAFIEKRAPQWKGS